MIGLLILSMMCSSPFGAHPKKLAAARLTGRDVRRQSGEFKRKARLRKESPAPNSKICSKTSSAFRAVTLCAQSEAFDEF